MTFERNWTKQRLSSIYSGMVQRCHNPKCIQYDRYGGRGIKVCDEWLNDKLAFFKFALLHGYNDKLTIDRIDNNKGYYPDNVRFVNMKRQARNTSQTKIIDVNGNKFSVKDFCDITGANYLTVMALVNFGMSSNYILNHPKVKPCYLAKKEMLNNSVKELAIVRS